MSRAPGLCRRCGGPKRGRTARTAAPWAQCAKEDCRADICPKHSVWDSSADAWICTKCARDAGIKVVK